MESRYIKQEMFAGLGPQGQARLGSAAVLIAGVGALGGHIAQLLVRAGVGRVRLVDSDYPEISNLHRQPLFDEADVESGLAKAEIAERKLKAINRVVKVEGLVARIGPENVLELMDDMDLVMDGLDNPQTRFLLNEAAVFLNTPWIHSGVAAAGGNVFTIIPGKTPCLRCLYSEPPEPGEVLGVDTVGIIGPSPAFASAYAAAEAIKFLSGAHDRLAQGVFCFNFWRNEFDTVPMTGGPAPDCPCCVHRHFGLLGVQSGAISD